MKTGHPEVWLRGSTHGIPALLLPVAHALLQAREDVARVAPGLSRDVLRARPGGVASPAFHLYHAAHALDRLMAYARAEPLHDLQRDALEIEATGEIDADAADLVDLVETTIDRALRQLRCTPDSALLDERRVGRSNAASSVLGLLFHGAEHTSRHVGQFITTVTIVRNAVD